MGIQQPLTREDLREELRRFAVGALKQDLPDMISQVREELRAELHLCFLEWSPHNAAPEQPSQPAPKPRADVPRDEPAEQKLSEDPQGASPESSKPSARRSPAAVLGCEVEVDGSPVDSQADTEASPRPAYRLVHEAQQGVAPIRNSRRSQLAHEIEILHRDQMAARASMASRASRASRGQAGLSVSISHGEVGGRQVSTASDHLGKWEPRDCSGSHGFFKRHYQRFKKSMHGTATVNMRRITASLAPRRTSRHATQFRAAQRSQTGFLARMVNSGYFDYATGLLILLNAASIGFQTDFMARAGSSEMPLEFRGLELFFCGVFTLELFIRLWVHRLYFFCSPDWMWNCFDMLLVILQLTEEMMGVWTPLATANDASSVNTDFSEMRILRILRLIRIIRLVRILRLIGELRTIVVSIAGSLRSLCWTVLLLMMMMYLIGVYMTQLILDYRTDPFLTSAPTTTIGTEQVALTYYFGSLGMAMLSLYQAITGGLNWHQLTDPLMAEISPWLSVMIGLYIAFSLFALMNVVTGVFVESALATAKSDRDMFLLQFVRKLFQEADKDASGSITWEEFKACLGSKEMQMYFEAFDLDIHEAKNLFQLLDINGSGEVDFEEFVNGCFRLRGAAKALDLATFMHGFSTWNEDWVNFARRVDWQLRRLLKVQGISSEEAPVFKSRRTSVRAPCGMSLISESESEEELDSDYEPGATCEAEYDVKGTDIGASSRSGPHAEQNETQLMSSIDRELDGYEGFREETCHSRSKDGWASPLSRWRTEPKTQNSGDTPLEPERSDLSMDFGDQDNEEHRGEGWNT